MEGSCDLNSLIYWEGMTVLHGKYLCDAGISRGFGAAGLGQAGLPSLPKPGGSCQGKEQQGTSQERSAPSLTSFHTPAAGSDRLGDVQQKFPHQLGGFCSALCDGFLCGRGQVSLHRALVSPSGQRRWYTFAPAVECSGVKFIQAL